MTDVNQKFVYSSNYTDKTSNLIMTDVNQKFIYSSNYTDRTSNLIMTDVNTKLNNKANKDGYTINSVVITDASGNITTTSTLPVVEGGTNKSTMTANRLLGCLGIANQYDEISLGTALSFSGNTLNANVGTSSQWTTGTNLIYYNGGNVGIGLTNPSGTLSILGLPANSAVSNSTGTLILSHNGGWGVNSAGSSIVFTQRLSSGGAGDQVAVGMINGVKTNSDGLLGGGLAFWTCPAGQNNLTEKMRIMGYGYVGIGITNPSQRLDVNGNINCSGQVSALQFILPTTTATAFYWGNSANAIGRAFNNGDYSSSASASDMVLRSVNNIHLLSGAGASAITVNTANNVGISNTAPFAPLCVGNSAINGSDGHIVIGKKAGAGTRHARIGYNSAFDFVIGDYGNNNTAGTWLEQVKVGYQAPANSLVVTNTGVGIGTLNPSGFKLYVDGNFRSVGDITCGQIYCFSQFHLGNANSILSLIDNGTYRTIQSWGSVPLSLNPSGNNVGIGRTNPSYTLDVLSSQMRIGLADNTDGKIHFGNSSHGVGRNGQIGGLNDANDVILWTAGSGRVGVVVSGNQRMRYDNSCAFRTSFNNGGDQVRFDANGQNYQTNNSASWSVSSDMRIKQSIETADYNICYDNVKNIELRRFEYSPLWKDRVFEDKKQLGFIAQEVEQFFPKSINITQEELTDGTIFNDCRSVDLNQMNFTLYGAFKKLMNMVEEQDARIRQLEEMTTNVLRS